MACWFRSKNFRRVHVSSSTQTLARKNVARPVGEAAGPARPGPRPLLLGFLFPRLEQALGPLSAAKAAEGSATGAQEQSGDAGTVLLHLADGDGRPALSRALRLRQHRPLPHLQQRRWLLPASPSASSGPTPQRFLFFNYPQLSVFAVLMRMLPLLELHRLKFTFSCLPLGECCEWTSFFITSLL